MKREYIFIVIATALGIVTGDAPAVSATASHKNAQQSVISNNTTVGGRTNANFIDTECQNIYNSCMDAMCIIDNEDGARCNCDDRAAALHKQMNEIISETTVAQNRARVQINAIQTNTVPNTRATTTSQTAKTSGRSAALLAMFDELDTDDNDTQSKSPDNPVGNARRTQAHQLCVDKLPDKCADTEQMLVALYSQQIRSDCAAFENAIKDATNLSRQTKYEAERSVREVALNQVKSANKLDLGGCLTETLKCMQGADACGKNWENCVVPGNVGASGITDDTMERIDINLTKCEYIRKECQSVADQVPSAFIAAFANQIHTAEIQADSQNRMSCINTVSECIRTACQDDIVGRGTATMDACLSRPEMAESFCSVELAQCGTARENVWSYVQARLAAMRVDSCTREVKECFTAPERCGADWTQCIGIDWQAMHDMCPIEKLVVCRQNNPEFSISDLDNMIMGVYLAMDNAALTQCEELAAARMQEICGDTRTCNVFTDNSDIGTTSLMREQRNDNVIISGLINWPLTMDANMQLDADAYLSNINKKNADKNASERVAAAITDVNAQIDRVIAELTTGDAKLAACINGRDMSQIQGRGAAQTTGRFPHLMDRYYNIVRAAAINQTMINYERKYMELKREILAQADIMNAQYACYAMPLQTDQRMYDTGFVMNNNNAATLLIPQMSEYSTDPWALSEVVTTSVTNDDIIKLAGRTIQNQASNGETSVTYELTTSFDIDTRECRVCTDGTVCTTRENAGSEAKNKIRSLLSTIATSCGIATVTAGVGNAINLGRTATMTTKTFIQVTSELIQASGAVGAVVGAGAGAIAAKEEKNVGNQIAWAATKVAVGAGVGTACGALATIVPVGTMVGAAITVISAMTSALLHEYSGESYCEVLDTECTVIQM